jgi:hypothetical protein
MLPDIIFDFKPPTNISLQEDDFPEDPSNFKFAKEKLFMEKRI